MKRAAQVKTKKRSLSTRQKKEIRDSETWAKAMEGPEDERETYQPVLTYAAGQVIEHPQFGAGLIEKVIDGNKIQVMFENSRKTLAQGL